METSRERQCPEECSEVRTRTYRKSELGRRTQCTALENRSTVSVVVLPSDGGKQLTKGKCDNVNLGQAGGAATRQVPLSNCWTGTWGQEGLRADSIWNDLVLPWAEEVVRFLFSTVSMSKCPWARCCTSTFPRSHRCHYTATDSTQSGDWLGTGLDQGWVSG